MKISDLYLYMCLILLGYSVNTHSYADEPYLQKNRIDYISKVLQAFADTPVTSVLNTYRYMNVIETNNCRSSLSDLKVQCLLNYAKENCKEMRNARSRASCELYSDIIIVNKLSEKTFVNRTERYRMLRNSSYDYRTAMTNRLQQKYSRIVTDFYLRKGADCDDEDFGCLARGLDQFCLDYTNTHSLSWQYCMSATLWFIGTSKRD